MMLYSFVLICLCISIVMDTENFPNIQLSIRNFSIIIPPFIKKTGNLVENKKFNKDQVNNNRKPSLL